jgi:Arc/MetJ-type ribon-helix-helix transcriptional regulator
MSSSLFEKVSLSLRSDQRKRIVADVEDGLYDSMSQALRHILDAHYQLNRKGQPLSRIGRRKNLSHRQEESGQ